MISSGGGGGGGGGGEGGGGGRSSRGESDAATECDARLATTLLAADVDIGGMTNADCGCVEPVHVSPDRATMQSDRIVNARCSHIRACTQWLKKKKKNMHDKNRRQKEVALYSACRKKKQ